MKSNTTLVRRQWRENRRDTKADTGQGKTSKDKPVYIAVQPTTVPTSSRTVASCPPQHTRERLLASARSQTSPEEPRRTKSSSAAARSRKNQRLMHSDAFEYKVVTINETEAEKAVRGNLLEDVKKQNWVENGETRLHSAYVTPTNKLGLIQRKYSLSAESAERRIQDIPRVTFKTSSHFCDRTLRLENGDFSKQFCEVFGPGMCTDCTKARRQHISFEDHVQSYPGVAVSPYALCVPKEKDAPKTSTVSRERDALYRRSLSRTSRDTPDTFRSSKARPNSSNDERTNSRMSDISVPYLVNDSRAHSLTESSWNRLLRNASPYSSVSSSRRSSISKNEDAKPNATQQPACEDISSPGADNESGLSRVNTASQVDQRPSPGNPQVRPSPRAGSRLNSSRTRLKTPSIERTGKLRELPYWRFLIPEPPKMEVGRMNVSIFTPKEIPGIKIFDESFFEL